MVAVINNFGGFYSRELYFHELKRSGAVLQRPCMNTSRLHTSISGDTVTMGFIHVDGLEQALIENIIADRRKHGPYLHLQDSIERLNPGIEQLNILIRIGAYSFTGKNKKELLWEANFLQKKSSKHALGHSLFTEQPVTFHLPELKQYPLDDALDEIELLGFPICNVFELADTDLTQYTPAAAIEQHRGREVIVIGYLITSKPVRTIKNEPMYFHTFIDAAGDWLDTIFFPPAATRYGLTGKGFYAMRGKVVEEFGVYSVEVSYSKKIGIKQRIPQAINKAS
jgi:DNA polymerase-3 subunit alpha